MATVVSDESDEATGDAGVFFGAVVLPVNQVLGAVGHVAGELGVMSMREDVVKGLSWEVWKTG